MNTRVWLRFMPAIVWAIILAVLLLIPSDSIPDSKLLSYDKLAHIGVFALLSGLIAFGAHSTKRLGRNKISRDLWTLTISIVYGSTLEILQQFSPGRMTDLYDLIANVAGTILGVVVFSIFIKNKFVIEKLIL